MAGLVQLLQKVTEHKKELSSRVFKLTQEEAAELEKTAKENATVYPRRRTGNLWREIKSVAVFRGSGNIEVGLFAGSGKSSPYAANVEYGLTMAPRRYLNRALKKVHSKYMAKLRRLLK